MTAPSTGNTRPRRHSAVKHFAVANELVLVSPDGRQTCALNESGAAIWWLCDGTHTLADLLLVLHSRFAGDMTAILDDLSTTLVRLHDAGLIESDPVPLPGTSETSILAGRQAAGRRIHFVLGIEDTVYFHWQLAIFFESMVDQLPTDWDVIVVVCNDHARLSPELTHLLRSYRVPSITGTHHGRSHDIDFSAGRGGYVPLNRVEALRAVANHVHDEDVVCLMDTDLFLYGRLRPELFPAGNAMATNWLIGAKRFMAIEPGDRGIDLQALLASIDCGTPLKPGGVTVFLTGATVRNEKVIRDCFRFAQILYLLGKVAGVPDHATWTAEMACFAMSLSASGLDYELLDATQFSVRTPAEGPVLDGTFYHYYFDVNDNAGRRGPFPGSQWHKQLFRKRDFILADVDSFRADDSSDLGRRFFDLALAARQRLHHHTDSPA